MKAQISSISDNSIYFSFRSVENAHTFYRSMKADNPVGEEAYAGQAEIKRGELLTVKITFPDVTGWILGFKRLKDVFKRLNWDVQYSSLFSVRGRVFFKVLKGNDQCCNSIDEAFAPLEEAYYASTHIIPEDKAIALIGLDPSEVFKRNGVEVELIKNVNTNSILVHQLDTEKGTMLITSKRWHQDLLYYINKEITFSSMHTAKNLECVFTDTAGGGLWITNMNCNMEYVKTIFELIYRYHTKNILQGEVDGQYDIWVQGKDANGLNVQMHANNIHQVDLLFSYLFAGGFFDLVDISNKVKELANIKDIEANVPNGMKPILTTGFTPKENEIHEHLIKAHNLFTELYGMHRDEATDWARGMHDLQKILGMRILRREHPEIYSSKK